MKTSSAVAYNGECPVGRRGQVREEHQHGQEGPAPCRAGEIGAGSSCAGVGAFEEDRCKDAKRDCAVGGVIADGAHAQDGQDIILTPLFLKFNDFNISLPIFTS